MSRRFTIMTAIPYVNGMLHIGNSLTTLSGDVTARYHRMLGEDVWFQVGTDENGIKIKEAAEKLGEDPHKFVEKITGRIVDVFRFLKISSDDLVRTTEPRHVRASQELFRRLQADGHIYTGTYEGWYDVTTETYFKEEDLVDGKSPDGNEVRWISEQNYFFRLSAFQDRLVEAYGTGKIKVVPEARQNEVLSFINQGLRDVCISRSNIGWGIPVPGDDSQVIYVWFDALINYITSCGWPEGDWEPKWPADVQWLGKDILTRFHATLWPAMLMGIGLEPPRVVAAHAWVLFGGEKISKSKGTAVEPTPLVDEFSERAGISKELAVDALRYWLVATMGFENDSTFTYDEFDRRYNSDLANDLGNALNRTLSMAHKFVGGVVPDAPLESDVVEAVAAAKGEYERAMAGYRLEQAAEAAIGLIRFLNKYIDTRAPWALAKTGDASLGSVVRSMLACVRTAEGMVRPIMPDAADAIAAQLGSAPTLSWDSVGVGSLPPGTQLGQPVPIFPRLEAKPAAPAAPKPAKEAKENKKPMEAPTQIEFAEFMKVQLRVARIIEAEPVEGSEKLMKLQVRIGDEPRQIIAGIKKKYAAEDLIGRQIIVVANLKPAKLMGLESQGMLLAADDTDGSAIILQPEHEAPDGANVH